MHEIYLFIVEAAETAVRRCSSKYLFLIFLQYSQKNVFAGVSF